MNHYLFHSGHVLDHDRVLFLAHDESALNAGVGIAEILLLEQGTRWRSLGRFNWQASALLPISDGNGSVLVLGRDGEIGLIAGGAATEEGRLAASAVGPTRGLVQATGQTLAFGMKREIFRRLGPSHWTAWNDGMNPPLPSGLSMAEAIKFRTRTAGGLHALTSGPDGSVYAFGLHGEIWRRRTGEAAWATVNSPTNLTLKGATSAGDGVLYACGQAGALVRGVGNRWEAVDYDGPPGLDFCSLAWFADTLFLADGHSLRRLRAGKLEIVDFGVGAIVPSAQLHAHAGMLLSVSGKEAFMTSDGTKWTALLTHPTRPPHE